MVGVMRRMIANNIGLLIGAAFCLCLAAAGVYIILVYM
jgi:hypothetical protein